MKTTFDLTTDLRSAMDKAREDDGYSVKRKSTWICEAILRLPSGDPTYAKVGLGEAREKFGTKICLTLSAEATEVIKKAKTLIRREDPESEGLSGQIIRAAIRLRLDQSGRRTGS